MEDLRGTPTFDCHFCGRRGYFDVSALRTHQTRNALCGFSQREHQRANILTVPDVDHVTKDVSDRLEREEGEEIPEIPEIPDIPEIPVVPELKDFDCTFQLVLFIRQCHNGGGLSQKDISQLLGLLLHPLFDAGKVEVRSVADICKYEENLADQRDDLTWQSVEVCEASEGIPRILMHQRNPLSVLEELFSNPKNGEGFSLRASTSFDGDSRSYTDLSSGKWWEEMQGDVEATCSGGIVAPVILYSDQTALSNNRKTQGWPMVMTLGNIDKSLRSLSAGHALLAVLPIMGATDPGLPDSKSSSRMKLELLHKCQSLILEPLKKASYTRLSMKDPSGKLQWVFPRFCLYICDQTEGSRMTCTFDTNKSTLPCSCCTVPKESLSTVSRSFPYRIEEQMKRILSEMHELPLVEQELVSKQHSVHPVECSLWGFAGGHLLHGNPY